MNSVVVESTSRSKQGLRLDWSTLNLKHLRWLSLGLPAAFLIGFDYLRHFVFPFLLFHDWPGFLIIWGGTLLGAFLLSRIVFGIIERMQRENLRRNRELAILHQAARFQTEQLKALHEAGMALTAELSLEAVLQNVVDVSRQLLGAQYAALAVFHKGEVERLITSGLSAGEKENITVVRHGLGVMASVPDQGKPLRLADIRMHPLFRGFPPNHPEMRTFLGVPIVSKGHVIGNLRLANKGALEPFTQEDEDIVVMLAAQAAIAIQNARLHEQDQALAILRERERIAQDMHDGIIQDIYAIGLGLEQCIEHAAANSYLPGRLSKAVDNLNDIIKNIRNYIFALEPSNLQGLDLEAGLSRVAQEFRINSLIDVELIVHGDVNHALSADQVGQVSQIAHEALTNVLRHAKATTTVVQATRSANTLELLIEDNGKGFDPKTSRGGLGLRNIAERAKALGGEVGIVSAQGKGARLTLTIPIKTVRNVES